MALHQHGISSCNKAKPKVLLCGAPPFHAVQYPQSITPAKYQGEPPELAQIARVCKATTMTGADLLQENKRLSHDYNDNLVLQSRLYCIALCAQQGCRCKGDQRPRASYFGCLHATAAQCAQWRKGRAGVGTRRLHGDHACHGLAKMVQNGKVAHYM